MIADGRLDLAHPLFWLVVLAVVPVAAIWVGPGRRVALAVLHTSVIYVVLGPAVAALALGVVGLLWGAARALAAPDRGAVWLWVAISAVTAVFIATKVPLGPTVPIGPWLAGIGFSYVFLRAIDLFRAVHDRVAPAPTLAEAICYLVPFHMLAAGPIQGYADFCRTPGIGPSSVRRVVASVDRIASGLFKKFVLAQALQSVFLTGFEAGGPYLLLEIQLHFVWVFLDFSAYSDIAVGIGGLMGVQTPENFDRPLTARNMIVFWERWHITLSEWIRHNLFTPIQLTLMRHGPQSHPLVPATVAFTVAFVLCGLWHGLTWRFALWGLSQAVGLVVCNTYRHILRQRLGRQGIKRYLANRPIRWIATALTFEFMACSIAFSLWPGGQ